MLIVSLYGETGHLKNKHHLEESISYNEKNKNQIDCIEDLDDNKVKKLKLLEYDLCNLIIQINLPFTDIEPIFNLLNKYSKSSIVKGAKINRHMNFNHI